MSCSVLIESGDNKYGICKTLTDQRSRPGIECTCTENVVERKKRLQCKLKNSAEK